MEPFLTKVSVIQQDLGSHSGRGCLPVFLTGSSSGDFQKVSNDFSYNSGTNHDFLSIQEIRDLIKINIDEKFKPI